MTVREIQQALRTIGWPLAVDGIYGPRTTAAVSQFQRGYTLQARLAPSAIDHLLSDGEGLHDRQQHRHQPARHPRR